MEVEKLEDINGVLISITFKVSDTGSFKSEIKTWLNGNYPEMTFQNFFERLIEFRSSKCVIDMRDL